MLISVLLLGASMNFQAKFFYFAFGLLIVLCIFERKITYNSMALVYAAVGILMGLYGLSDGFMAVARRFAYVACYLVGYNVMFLKADYIYNTTDAVQCQEKRLRLFMAMFAIGSFSHLMLNWINSAGLNLARNTPDIWSGETMSATGQTAIGCLMVGFSCGLILYPRKKIERLVGTMLALLLFGYNLILSGRTIIMMYILIFAIGVTFMLKIRCQSSKIIKFIIWIMLLIIIFAVAYYNDFGGIRDTIQSSNLYDRFFGTAIDVDILKSGRSERKLDHLFNMYKYPFGGKHSRAEFGYAHDLLLDAYDEYGVFELMLLIGILGSSINNLRKLLINKLHSTSFKIGILSMYAAILIQFCLEPIFAGMPWLFVCFCFLNGCVARLNKVITKASNMETESDRLQTNNGRVG